MSNIKNSLMMFSRSGMCSNFLEILHKNEQFLVIACSGGPDSAALMGSARVLLNRNLIKKVDVVHINHNLRKEALDDMNVCREQSKIFNFPFFHYDIYPQALNGNIYQESRKLRYQMLQHHSVKNKCDVILTAHHSDDMAETVLMHLARGCGVDGLCGVRQRQNSLGNVDIVRPFLSIRKSKLENLCVKENIPFCIDKSNFNIEKTRAYVRHSVIPALEKINPCFVEHVAKTAMIMQSIVEKNKIR